MEGYKKLRIEELTKNVGIAQGTFYHFYKTKESLIFDLSTAYQTSIDQRVYELIENKGFIDSNDFAQLYQNMFLNDDDNVFRFLKRSDIDHLVTRLSVDINQLYEASRSTMSSVFDNLKNPRKNLDQELVFNLIQLLNLTVENKDLLVHRAFEKTIDAIISQMVHEIFEI